MLLIELALELVGRESALIPPTGGCLRIVTSES
jgi:hypothetical protein